MHREEAAAFSRTADALMERRVVQLVAEEILLVVQSNPLISIIF
jgi:hypothetical protein